MNEASPPNTPPRDMAYSCLLYLEYAMAGDLESVEILETLLKRWRDIPWNDPVFVAFSEQMQAVPPPFDGNKTLVTEATVAVYSTTQKMAEINETLAMALPDYRRAVESLQKLDAFNAELFEYFHKMVEIHTRMRDRLEMLGADVSPYTLPDLPKNPNL